MAEALATLATVVATERRCCAATGVDLALPSAVAEAAVVVETVAMEAGTETNPTVDAETAAEADVAAVTRRTPAEVRARISDDAVMRAVLVGRR